MLWAEAAGRREGRDNATGSGHVEFEIAVGDSSGAFQQAKRAVPRKFKLGIMSAQRGLLRYWMLLRNCC